MRNEDTIYYLNEEKLGCTGPHFFNQKISWVHYNSLESSKGWQEKALLLPMVYITKSEKEDFKELVLRILEELPIQQEDYIVIYNAITENCLQE